MFNPKGYTIKYYKGLGTSTDIEAKDYFRHIEKYRRRFVRQNNEDDDAIDLAFNKKKIIDRKNWLENYKVGTYLDSTIRDIRYKDFINK